MLQRFPKDYFAADFDRSKCLHATSSNVLFCMHCIGNVIYHKFSHGDVCYRLNGKNVNVVLELFLNFFEHNKTFPELSFVLISLSFESINTRSLHPTKWFLKNDGSCYEPAHAKTYNGITSPFWEIHDKSYGILYRSSANIAYLPPPQENFTWVPNCSLGQTK